MTLRSTFAGLILSAALLAVGCSCCHKKPACSTCPPAPPIPPPPVGASSGFDATTVPAVPNTPPYVSGTTR